MQLSCCFSFSSFLNSLAFLLPPSGIRDDDDNNNPCVWYSAFSCRDISKPFPGDTGEWIDYVLWLKHGSNSGEESEWFLFSVRWVKIVVEGMRWPCLIVDLCPAPGTSLVGLVQLATDCGLDGEMFICVKKPNTHEQKAAVVSHGQWLTN